MPSCFFNYTLNKLQLVCFHKSHCSGNNDKHNLRPDCNIGVSRIVHREVVDVCGLMMFVC